MQSVAPAFEELTTSSTQTIGSIAALTPGTWDVDPAHSLVSFVARHAMVAKVRGRFDRFEGTITIAEDLPASSVWATVDLASIDTGDPTRDDHLRSADFFDVEEHPQMTFVSTGVRQEGDHYVVSGDLTVRGVTRPLDLDVEFNGVTRDPMGRTRAGFSATGQLNRKDFGLTWNMLLEAGGVLVSDTITLELEIAAVLRSEG